MTIDTTTSGAASTTQAILERAGFQIRGKRATCPYCHGNRNLTVSVTDDGLWYCHRCQRGGDVRGLARQQGDSLAPPRVRKADNPKTAFRAWMSQKMSDMANEERRAYARRDWAVAALQNYPDFEPAWDFLRWFYERRYVWEQFWESASDNVGRYWLYRAWRRHYAG